MLVHDLANRPARPARSRVLRLRGLPYRALEDDIILFLAPLPVTRVHICRRNGRTTGEAYVQFSTRYEAGQAVRTKNRRHLGNRYIEVFEAGESDIGHPEGTPASVATTSDTVVRAGLTSTTVRIAGVVSSTSAQDIANFLKGVQLLRGLDSITFFGDAAFGNRTAVVEVADESAYQTALNTKQQSPGDAHLQVHPISNADLAAFSRGSQQHNVSAQQPASAGQSQHLATNTRPQLSPPPSFRADGSTLKLRGLPYSASVSDILNFFEGFHLRQADVHLETKNVGQDKPTGTGVAYVQFSSPDSAEDARSSRHKQSMGARYIECMTLVAGRQRFPLADTSLTATATPLLPLLLPGGPNPPGARISSAAPHLSGRQPSAAELPVESPGWSPPFSPRSLYPREGLLPSVGFRHGLDQGTSSASMTGSYPPTSGQPRSATPRGVPGQMQGQVLLGLQQEHNRQQQQQLMMQQQFALQQQQQMLMQQQAMRQWGGQQWQGNMTPMGLGPQGWVRAGPYSMRMAPGGPLQMGPMASRQPVQGGMAYAYTGPLPGYAWAPMHPANPPMMGARAFAWGQQPPEGIPYPPRQDPLDSRLPYNPHASRTPGRGNTRTPFSRTSQTRFSHPQPQPAALSQPSCESGLLSQVAMTADSSADATPATQVLTNTEALSLTDSVSAQRLTPIVTHRAMSPSNAILASTARSNAPEGQQEPTATAAAQDSPVPQQALHLLESAPLPVTDGF